MALFEKLLVANRGEIALRVIRACRELRIATVAVYSEVDRDSLHVRYADEAYLIGPGPARESYLSIARIMEVARKAGVDAIHPGYGFLAENPSFAVACKESGITFVGPPARAIRVMGDKVLARRLMEEAGLPVVPGSELLASREGALSEARHLGFPLLIKAVAGGGGRGMRTVYDPEELARALESAGLEAASAFGNAGLYLEKLLSPVRHVEVQIIADAHGNIVALGERECSIQRRHQKLIEEAPSPAVDEASRQRLMGLAVKAARVAGYENVGTVEFLLDREGNIHFLEMNTRLQVEHPVTELVTGVDMVADQILVAAGERLPYRQEDVHLCGWAIECRIVAEDPFHDFLPSVGRVTFVSEPGGPGVRVDSALYHGLEIPVYYDSLIAKLSTWGRNRQEALNRMRRALREFKIVGVNTNIPFHLHVMEDIDFITGRLDTSFVERRFDARPGQRMGEKEIAILASVLLAQGGRRPRPRRSIGDGSPWRLRGRPLRRWPGPGAGWQTGRAIPLRGSPGPGGPGKRG